MYFVHCIFKDAISRVSNIEKAVAGFRKTGIYPFDPDVFSDDDFEACNRVFPIVEDVGMETRTKNSDFEVINVKLRTDH